jgi:hypothetical protein
MIKVYSDYLILATTLPQRYPPKMKFLTFEDTDSVVLSLSSVSALGFGLPNLVAPDAGKSIAWEDTVAADATAIRFMGHGISTVGVTTGLLNNLSTSDKKDALKVLSAVHLSVAAMVGHATYNKDLKQPVGVANVILHSALAVACAARGFKNEEDEDKA